MCKTLKELVKLFRAEVTPPNDAYESRQSLHGYTQGFYRGAAIGFEAGYKAVNEKNDSLLLIAQWIDAKKAMPPANTWCLVDSDEGVMSAYYYGNDIWSEGGIAWIKYWMPLPKQPYRS